MKLEGEELEPINKIERHMQGDKVIDLHTNVDSGEKKFVGIGMAVIGNRKADLIFEIKADTIQEAFARYKAAGDIAYDKAVQELRKPRLAIPGRAN